jgi:hypothetical protein
MEQVFTPSLALAVSILQLSLAFPSLTSLLTYLVLLFYLSSQVI